MADHAFCRKLLAEVMKDVRKKVPKGTIKKAWGYKYSYGNNQVEFQIPGTFYWNGQACCKTAAKAKGWRAYLNKISR